MITPELERLILSGFAEYRTIALGGSAVGTIPLNENAEYMVVTDILWNPFHDKAVGADNQIRTIHTLRLYNGKKTNHWNFRDTFIPASGHFNGTTQINCFFLSKTDVFIDIFNFSTLKAGDVNYINTPLITEEIEKPFGYGNANSVQSITSTAGAVINNMNTERNPAETPVLQRARNEFFDNIDATTQLANPGPLGFHWAFPLVTFGVVYVNRLPNNNQR